MLNIIISFVAKKFLEYFISTQLFSISNVSFYFILESFLIYLILFTIFTTTDLYKYGMVVFTKKETFNV